MNTTAIGRRAEGVVAEFLEEQGYKIIGRNWRTRYCEIDLIACLKGVVYFVEVKYRANDRQGTGLDYITIPKLQRMYFAAELWVSRHLWPKGYEIAVAAVTGRDFKIEAFVTDL
jgi:uncharacterized protein (TIGR00252 family)